MKVSTFPGFKAERSLYRANGPYGGAPNLSLNNGSNSILPQRSWWRCALASAAAGTACALGAEAGPLDVAICTYAMNDMKEQCLD